MSREDRAAPQSAPEAAPEAAGPPRYTDTHAHLRYVASRLGERALEALLDAYGLAWAEATPADRRSSAPFILDIGTDPGDLAPRAERLGKYPFLRFAAGLWPGKESLERPAKALALLENDVDSPLCCALGECGLDYHHMEASREEQIRLFEEQAVMAVRKALPLIVHSRKAFEDTLAVVSNYSARIPVVIHCFGYGEKEAEKFLERGCTLSFAGNITYKNSERLVGALRLAPLGKILLETDAPYMNPSPLRGRASTPLDISRTMEFAAASRGVSVEALSAAVQANALRIFSGMRSHGGEEPA